MRETILASVALLWIAPAVANCVSAAKLFHDADPYIRQEIDVSDLHCRDTKSGFDCIGSVGKNLVVIDAIILGGATSAETAEVLIRQCKSVESVQREACRFHARFTIDTQEEVLLPSGASAVQLHAREIDILRGRCK